MSKDREIALEAARQLQRAAIRVSDPKLRTTMNSWAGRLRQAVVQTTVDRDPAAYSSEDTGLIYNVRYY